MAIQWGPAGRYRELALFGGAGGGILGAKLLGWRTVCAVEADLYAARVLVSRQEEGHLEPFPVWDDVCSFDGYPWRGRVDVVSGGFPCTNISAAGKGEGISGKASGLWKQMFRVVGEVQPEEVFVENSPLLTGRGLDEVLCDLASLGYDAEWGVIGAADAIWLGCRPCIDHERNRIWILAKRADSDSAQRRANNSGRRDLDKQSNRLPEGRQETASGTRLVLPPGANSEHSRLSKRRGTLAAGQDGTDSGRVRGNVPQGEPVEATAGPASSNSKVNGRKSRGGQPDGHGPEKGRRRDGKSGGVHSDDQSADSLRVGAAAGQVQQVSTKPVCGSRNHSVGSSGDRPSSTGTDSDNKKLPSVLEVSPRNIGASKRVRRASVDANLSGRQMQRDSVATGAEVEGVECDGWWSVEPAVGRVADGLANRVDRLRCTGNGQVPVVAAVAYTVLSNLLLETRQTQR